MGVVPEKVAGVSKDIIYTAVYGITLDTPDMCIQGTLINMPTSEIAR